MMYKYGSLSTCQVFHQSFFIFSWFTLLLDEDKKDILNNKLGSVSNRKKPLNINSNNLQWGVSGQTTEKVPTKTSKQDESTRKCK